MASCSRLAAQRIEQRHHIAGAVVIDVVRAQHLPRELLQIEILFVGGVVGADDAELAARGFDFVELLPPRLSSAFDHETSSSLPFTRTSGDCSRSG